MSNKYDLIVVGGGFSGTAAAISAAKNGANVLLIEKFNCLGGAASFALVSPFMGFWTTMPETKERKYMCGGLFLEIIDEMNIIAGKKDEKYIFDEEILKLVLNRMARKYGVKLLFNTDVIDVCVNDGTVSSVVAMCKSKRLEFFADYFIDATGDAELSVLAGCEYKLGREKDELCQPMTLCFRMSGVDKEKYYKNKKKIDTLYKELQARGKIKNPRENVLVFENFNDGVLHFNTTRIVKKNPTDPFELTEAEIEAREQVFEMHKFLKENIEGFENSRILSTAMHIGIRESRKIVGEYILTENDLLSLARFDDAISTCNYSIDIHSPDGTGTRFDGFGAGEWYEIPYRCLIPKKMNNLLVAGRCISSTHEAQSSYRIMACCSQIGQAAGNAVCLAMENKLNVRDIDINKLQTILRKNGFEI